MSTETDKAIKSDQSQNTTQTVDKSRRSFAKAGVIAPVIMTLTSKTALGGVYQCAISGAQSGNTSSHAPAPIGCGSGAGISPGGWWQNASKLKGDPDGGLDQWLCAGINPFSIKLVLGVKKIQLNQAWVAGYNAAYDQIALHPSFNSKSTSFYSIFGSLPGSGAVSMHDVLYLHQGGGGTLEFHAVADYLNAALYANGCKDAFADIYKGISPADIVGLYHLGKSNTPFTSSTGAKVNGNFNGGANGSGVLSFLKMIHH